MAIADIFTARRHRLRRRDRARSARPDGARRGMAALDAWVDEIAALTQPDPSLWCDGSRAEDDALAARDGRRGQADPAEPGVAARPLPRPHRPERRRPRRGPHLHLLRARGGRRPHEQLARPGRDARRAARALRRLDARPHDVRRAVLDGAGRRPALAASACRSPTRAYAVASIGIMTRVGDDVTRADRRRRAVGPDRAPRRRARCATRDEHGCRVAVQRRRSTSCTSPRRARSGRSARATAATPSSPRSASRCASPR